MANFTKTTVEKESRTELHEKLSLTGAEISVNELPVGVSAPMIKCKKTPKKKCRFMAERREKR